jgi:SOS-response transcriptional repressor LexA
VTLAKKLQALLEEKDTTSKAIADLLGITPPNVSQWLKGHRKTIPVASATAIIRHFKLPSGHFDAHLSKQGKRAATAGVAIPLLGDLGAGRPRDDPADTTDSLPVSELFPAGAVAYRVKGRSMEADCILNGDYVVAVPSSAADAGEKVVVWIDGQGGHLKRYDKAKHTIYSGNGRNRWTHVMRPEDLILGVFVGLIRKG